MATRQGLEGTSSPKSGKGPPGRAVAPESARSDLGHNHPPRHFESHDAALRPAHPGRPVPDHDLTTSIGGKKQPRDSARLHSRSGARFFRCMWISCCRRGCHQSRVKRSLHIVGAKVRRA